MICAILKIIVSIYFLICYFYLPAPAPIALNIWASTLFSGVYDIYRSYKEKHIVISKDNIKDYKEKKLFRSYINIALGLILLIFSCLAISGTPKSMFELTGSLAVLVILVYSAPVIVGLLCLTSGVYNVSKTKNLYLKFDDSENNDNNIELKSSDEKNIDPIEKEPIVHQTSEEKNIESAVIEPTIFQTADMKTNELNPTQKYKQKKSRNYNKLVIALLILTTVLTLINSAILITPHIANNISKQEYKVTFYYNENVYFSVDNDTGVEQRRGNSTDSSSFYKMVTTSDYIDSPKTPTHGSYKFYGWYTEPECINRFDFNQKINRDTKLYAKWVRYY